MTTALEALLEALRAQAAAQWPQVEVTTPLLAAHVARLAMDDATRVALCERPAAVDLALVAAWLAGVPAAIAVFEEGYMPLIRRAVHRAGLTDAAAEEAALALRARLLTGDAEQPPKLLAFEARGDLRGWLRVVAVREALQLARRVERERRAGSNLQAMSTPAADLELELFKARHRDAFHEAFRDAVAQLDSRERILLRYRFLDGLTEGSIARIYDVHRVTMARWVARARRRLLELTRERLAQRFRLHESELDSVMREAQSQMATSLGSLFAGSQS